MQLLPKSVVDRARIIDRHREIEEGKKLATKVDTLRELASTEEKNLLDFRDKSVAAVKESIRVLLEDKQTILNEIHELEERKQKALKPLNSEWEELTRAQQEQDTWQKTLTKKEASLKETERLLQAKTQELTAMEIRVTDMGANAKEQKALAENAVEEARRILDKARNDAQRILSTVEVAKLEVSERERAVGLREKEVQMSLYQVEHGRRENQREQIRLADERLSLQKAIIEINQSK